MEHHPPSTVVTSGPVITKTTQLQLDSGDNKKSFDENLEACSGVLDVYIHQARDIHNICIYQNQDVYAKLWLTSDPERKESTQVINRGGRNPVFNENVLFSVRTINSALRCEVWMLSRIRNYLEDQLLGFTMVPLSDILIENGILSKEFSLSSSDLLHSPAGFVQLTLRYNGALPEVMEISRPSCCIVADVVDKDSRVDAATSNQLDKIEFPDLEVVHENECMASEYFVIPCPDLEWGSADQFGFTENGGQISPHSHVCSQETVDVDAQVAGAIEVPLQTPSTTCALKSSSSVSVPMNTLSASEAPGVPESQKQNDVSESKAGTTSEVEEIVKSLSLDIPGSSLKLPGVNVLVNPEQNVVEQKIIDMYMRSVNQFTEALAKIKLPIDNENGTSTENAAGNSVKSGCSAMPNASKDTEPCPKVFYGSRAFF